MLQVVMLAKDLQFGAYILAIALGMCFGTAFLWLNLLRFLAGCFVWRSFTTHSVKWC